MRHNRRSATAKSEMRATPEQIVNDIRRATRKHLSAEEKIRIVLEGLRDDVPALEVGEGDPLRLPGLDVLRLQLRSKLPDLGWIETHGYSVRMARETLELVKVALGTRVLVFGAFRMPFRL